MTDTYGPMDGFPWADQTQWYRHAPKWTPSGVNGSPGSSSSAGDLGLSLSGLTPTIAAGRAWVRGAGFERSAGAALPAVSANTNGSLSRRDRIVLRRDLAAKTVALTSIAGTPSASPSPPAIQQVETGTWDLPLFSFLVPPNSGTSISGIIDERLFLDAQSGLLSVNSDAALFALHTDVLTSGMRVLSQGSKRLYRFDGSAWQYAGGAPPPIVAVTMNVGSGWTAGSGFAPGCYKDASGLVHVVGGFVNGGAYTPNGAISFAFTLPVGYRPAVDTAVTVMAPVGTGFILGGIYTADGSLRVNANNSVTVPGGTLHTVNFSFHPGFTSGALA